MQQLTELIDRLPDQAALLDAQGRIIHVNEPWRAFAVDNGARTEFLGENYFDVCLASGDQEGARAAAGIRATMERDNGAPFVMTYSCHSRAELRWFQMQAWRFEERTVVQHVRLQLPPRLDDDGAAQKILAGIAHDIRSALNAVVGFSGALKTGAFERSLEKYEEYADAIAQAATYVTELADEMLDFAQAQHDAELLGEKQVEVRRLIDEAIVLCHRKASDHGVNITLRQADDVRMNVDRRRIRQVLVNLIDNSIKYMGGPGNVDIEAARRTPVGDLTITVSDDGPGIDRREIERALAPFERIERRGDAAASGVGLGLATCDYLMRLHGGRLSIDPWCENGARIVLTFPAWRVL